MKPFICLAFTALMLSQSCLSAKLPDNANEASYGQRLEIEKWYAQNYAIIQFQALDIAEQIPPADRVIWTEFFKMNFNLPVPENTFIYTTGNFVRNGFTLDLYNSMLDNFFLAAATDFLMDDRAHRMVAKIAYDNYEIAPALLRNYALKLLPSMQSISLQLSQLQNARAVKLQQLRDSEKQPDSQLSQTQAPALPGTVNAIVLSNNNAFAQIEGVDEMVKPGDVVNNAVIKNVRILKIAASEILLQKGNQAWVQEIGQTPKQLWTN